MCFGLALHAVYLHFVLFICLSYILFYIIETVFYIEMVVLIFKYLPFLNSCIVHIIIIKFIKKVPKLKKLYY